LSVTAFSRRLWWRYQQYLAATAVAAYGILWINGNPPDPLVVLCYTFILGNLDFLALDWFWVRYSGRGTLQHWGIFLIVELVLIPPLVVIATAIGFVVLGPAHMPGPFWFYLATGWKIPAFLTLLFGTGYAFYRRMETNLERRNRELQRTVASVVAGKEQQEQELERAREIQEALLPKEIAQVPGFEVVAAWQPARIVGGDYYDVIRLGEARLGICIADVVGKGVSAALLMANVQATVRAYASEPAPPSWLCRRVNQVLCDNLAADKFVTLFYGILDAGQRTLEYANAGHLPPLLLRAAVSTARLNLGGAVLGVFRNATYEDGLVHLASGDRLLLFTDGISEAMREDGEEFGEAGLLEAARSGAPLSPAELKTHLLAEVNQFCHSQLHDDATLLVIAAEATTRESRSDLVVTAASQ
jgi:sigma-B regulation protein RsbU (phosphoserine phosphatase)